MTRVIPLALAFWTYLCIGVVAAEPKLPEGVTCSDVRAHVAQYGKIAAYAWAKLQGYTAQEIREAKKCLR